MLVVTCNYVFLHCALIAVRFDLLVPAKQLVGKPGFCTRQLLIWWYTSMIFFIIIVLSIGWEDHL